MALLYIDGFEDYDDASTLTDMISNQANNGVYWNSYNALSLSTTSSQARTTQTAVTSKSLQVSGAWISLTVPTVSTLIVGFGWRQSWVGTNSICGFANTPGHGWFNSPSNGIRFQCNSQGQVEVYNNNTGVLIASSTASMPPATWNYIEIKYVFGTTTGEIQVRVDNEVFINSTGINTTGTAASINALYLQGMNNGLYTYYDDLYVCDASGTSNNNFLGPIYVCTMPPTADSSVQMTPSTGTTNFNLVDEPTANTTDYVTATVSNWTDLYAAANLPTTLTASSIPGVLIKTKSMKPTANSGVLQLGAKANGTTAWSQSKTINQTTYKTYFTVMEKQPDGTTDWNQAAVDGIEIGIKAI